MKIICAPSSFDFSSIDGDLYVALFDRTNNPAQGSIGAAIKETIVKQKLNPNQRAWDFLSIALSAIAADYAGRRDISPDGWTREFELRVAVTDPNFWNSQAETLCKALNFLTTDTWRLHFLEGGFAPAPLENPTRPQEDCITLLSGGLDSFIGILDLCAKNRKPMAVSHSVRGDAEKQREIVTLANAELQHLQLNHNVRVPNQEQHPTQRSRSMAFFSYAVLAATTLEMYQRGERVTLYVCENGFITINAPLTDLRAGGLSTRTCNPVFLALLQQILDAAGIQVHIENPYALKTKGEMLSECREQQVLHTQAYKTTSCGRFQRYGYKHCGRCVPCLIRRAAFHKWGVTDETEYKFSDLSIQNSNHANFDDVRAAAMAVANVEINGLDKWLGATLSSPLIDNRQELKGVVERGLDELKALLNTFHIQ